MRQMQIFVHVTLLCLSLFACQVDEDQSEMNQDPQEAEAEMNDQSITTQHMGGDDHTDQTIEADMALPLKWFSTCGDPACSEYRGPTEGLPACTDQVDGETCSVEGETCDLMNACNSQLICATSFDHQMCPESVASSKTSIVYLNESELQKLAQQTLDLPIAQWKYKRDSKDDPTRIGFIIDEHTKGLPLVRSNQKQVDLYGYTTMAIILLQQQAKTIQNLEKRVKYLENKIEKDSSK